MASMAARTVHSSLGRSHTGRSAARACQLASQTHAQPRGRTNQLQNLRLPAASSSCCASLNRPSLQIKSSKRQSNTSSRLSAIPVPHVASYHTGHVLARRTAPEIKFETEKDLYNTAAWEFDDQKGTPEERRKARGTDYRIVSGFLLERIPVVTPTPFDWEKDMAKIQDDADRRNKKPIPGSLFQDGKERMPPVNPEFETEFEDPLPRITPDDIANNRRSTYRRLDTSVYLIVKKNREKHAWQFPQGGVWKGESLRMTAERELEEECGKGMRTYTIGHAPVGHIQYEYPDGQTKELPSHELNSGGAPKIGAKVFFMHGLWLEGEVEIDGKEIVDYAWVAKDEFAEYFEPDGQLLDLCQRMVLQSRI